MTVTPPANCPKCSGALHPSKTSAVLHCSACAGVWVSGVDLAAAIDEPDSIRKAIETAAAVVPFACPSCTTGLQELSFRGCEIDCCPGCHGVFFDLGELEKVHKIRTRKASAATSDTGFVLGEVIVEGIVAVLDLASDALG